MNTRPSDETLQSGYAIRAKELDTAAQYAQALSIGQTTATHGAQALRRGQAAREWWACNRMDALVDTTPFPEDFLTAIDLDSPLDGSLLGDLLWTRSTYADDLHGAHYDDDGLLRYEAMSLIGRWSFVAAPANTRAVTHGLDQRPYLLYADTLEALESQEAALRAAGLDVVNTTWQDVDAWEADPTGRPYTTPTA